MWLAGSVKSPAASFLSGVPYRKAAEGGLQAEFLLDALLQVKALLRLDAELLLDAGQAGALPHSS